MFCLGVHRWAKIAEWILLSLMLTGVAMAAPVRVEDPATLLKLAEHEKTAGEQTFSTILDQLERRKSELSNPQLEHLQYLQAWLAAYRGDYVTSDRLVNNLIAGSRDSAIRFRVSLFQVNTLSERLRFEEALQKLTILLGELPEVTDPAVRAQALTSASYLFEDAGQYDLAINYADQLLNSQQAIDDYTCIAGFSKMGSLYRSEKLDGIEDKFQRSIEICEQVHDSLYANGLRYFVAKLEIKRGRAAEAVELLQKNYKDVQKSGYYMLMTEWDALLGDAYWNLRQVPQARYFAERVVSKSIGSKYAEALSLASNVLYQIEKQKGNTEAALAYHEKYMAADRNYQGSISDRALAYQVVQQELLSRKLQIDTLSKQNQILQLQQTLDHKATETSRLYIILLVAVLTFIAFWTYRIKRSQLRFMRQARRDGLTDIFNRQHFVSEAEQQLQYCRKSGREACLVLIDLDHFKAVNDTYGHAVGDRVLKRAVAACQAHLHSTDILGRLGGEEFGIVLPECTLEQVLGRAEQIRLAIVEVVRGDAADDICVSASFGVASTTRSGHELRQLLIHADDALYQAKREGRNRVSVSDGRAKPRLNAVGAATEEVQ